MRELFILSSGFEPELDQLDHSHLGLSLRNLPIL